MEPRIAGRRVLVTGGSRGVGRALVLAFAAAGARVVTCCRQDGTAQELGRELKEAGGDHLAVAADVTDPAAVAGLAEQCRTHLGGLDVLVNNVGADGVAPAAELAGREWHRVLDANLTSAFLVTRAVLPLLADGASVINVGSSAAARGRPHAAHYAASKSALIGFGRSLVKELGGRGIRVNTVAPGLVETPGSALPAPLAERMRAATPLGRLAAPADVAGPVLFLAGDLARHVTGVTLQVDGGL